MHKQELWRSNYKYFNWWAYTICKFNYWKNCNQTGGTATDFDGNYTIKPVDPGTYSIKVTCVGFGAVEITGVIVSANKITFQDVKLQEGIAIGEIKIIEYKKPLLDQDNLSGETKTSEEIVALPTRSVASVAASTAGIYQQDEGDDVNIRGSRDNATTYYIDGIRSEELNLFQHLVLNK